MIMDVFFIWKVTKTPRYPCSPIISAICLYVSDTFVVERTEISSLKLSGSVLTILNGVFVGIYLKTDLALSELCILFSSYCFILSYTIVKNSMCLYVSSFIGARSSWSLLDFMKCFLFIFYQPKESFRSVIA